MTTILRNARNEISNSNNPRPAPQPTPSNNETFYENNNSDDLDMEEYEEYFKLHEQIMDDAEVHIEDAHFLLMLNYRYTVVRHNGKVSVMERMRDHKDQTTFNALTEKDFVLRHKSEKIRVAKMTSDGVVYKEKDIGKYWLTWRHRTTHDSTVFEPGLLSKENSKRFYNLYPGFSVNPKNGDCSRTLEHLFTIWCDENIEWFHYLLTWFAHLIQMPWQKPGVALVINGGKGAGKSTIFEGIFQKILGKMYCKIAHRDNLSGKFNAHQVEKLLLVLEEAFFAGDHQAEAVIKSMITEKSTLIEPKGVDAFEQETFYRLAFVSNDKHVVSASMDERRFFALTVSDAKADDHQYFQDLNQEIKNGGVEAFMEILSEWKIEHSLLRKPPLTPALFDNIYGSLDALERWAWDFLHISDNHESIRWSSTVTTADLYDHFEEWIEKAKKLNARTGRNTILNDQAFSRQFNKLFGFKATKVRGLNAKIIPSRNEARKIFESQVKAKIIWLDIEEESDSFFSDEHGSSLQPPVNMDEIDQMLRN